MTTWRLRPEETTDRAAIDALLVASFPTAGEADLVHALRGSGELSTSLVAEIDGALVGHVAFSPVTVDGSAVRACGLAPIAVAAAHRGKRIAGDLVRAGLHARRAAGDELAVVLGSPRTYGRLAFRPASTLGLTDDYGGGDAFQALSLRPGAAAAAGGAVHYAAAFGELGRPPAEEAGPQLGMILAVADDGALGRKGGLPWDLPEDRAHFERTTLGRTVIMGRRTWEEGGRALPGRRNVVVSSRTLALSGATVVPSLAAAIALARASDPMPFVIGGRRLFEEAWPLATRVYLTEVPHAQKADVFVDLDRSAHAEVASWRGARGERYVVLAGCRRGWLAAPSRDAPS